ncbi:MAG: hypothetical protein JWQ08_1751, partial [Deinococcus sp.]|nr:hypothetical protein [Deinococcus sp.]
MKRLLWLPLALAALNPGAQAAAPAGILAYLRGGAAWIQEKPGQPARLLPQSQGAVLLDISPTSGSVAFMTGPAGTSVHADQVPARQPFLSKVPYTSSRPLSAIVPDPTLRAVRARWLRWEGDGRNLIAGTDEGTVGWNLVKRQSFIPNQTPFYQTTSLAGEVTATLGSVQSPDEPGVLLYGPGARPGTEVFSRRLPQNLMRALQAQKQPAIQRFLKELSPQAQADDVSWSVTLPQVTQDGRRVYFASNGGWGIGSGGTTTAAIFEVDVETVQLSALGWMGRFSGSGLDLLPSPHGRLLLILETRHISNLET